MFLPQCCLLCFLIIECSSKKKPLRIYGGTSAKEDEYPFVVRMEARLTDDRTNVIYHKFMCTASAITSTWALTAGHCVSGAIQKDLNVVMRYGPVENSPYHEDTFSDVILKVIHPSYKYSFEFRRSRKMKNDIGLLKTTPMKVKRFGKLSAVDFFSLYGYEAVQAGYGLTTTKLSNGTILTNTTLDLLKPLQIMTVLIYKCKQTKLRPVLCLAPKCRRRITACQGDSGGPLIHSSGVVGVLSLGEPSRDCLSPTRNRRVITAGHSLPIGPYIEWIQSHLNA